jgi:hypothetical protein
MRWHRNARPDMFHAFDCRILTAHACSRPRQLQAVGIWRRAVSCNVDSCSVSQWCLMKMRRLCFVRSHSCVGRYVTGNNSDVLPLPSDLPFTSVGGSAFGNEPSTFGALFGFFSFESDASEGPASASGRQACIVHNQRTNFPALFTLNIAHGFSVAEYSETSRSQVNAVSKHNSTHTSHSWPGCTHGRRTCSRRASGATLPR